MASLVPLSTTPSPRQLPEQKREPSCHGGGRLGHGRVPHEWFGAVPKLASSCSAGSVRGCKRRLAPPPPLTLWPQLCHVPRVAAACVPRQEPPCRPLAARTTHRALSQTNLSVPYELPSLSCSFIAAGTEAIHKSLRGYARERCHTEAPAARLP